ncbi:CcmD family protein [Arachidicoccus sp.]|uniref:CcmD family protein n=1 Tax=Arachidicoccus sp. TaxID=1872624 RepID=UPI003D23B229
MNIFKKLSLLITLCLLGTFIFAQDNTVINTAPKDFMESNGKIYVVVAVVLVIIIGLFFYLFNIDRKLSRLEKGEKK